MDNPEAQKLAKKKYQGPSDGNENVMLKPGQSIDAKLDEWIRVNKGLLDTRKED